MGCCLKAVWLLKDLQVGFERFRRIMRLELLCQE